MHDTALQLAVVGHTNTGKTSLLRTLLRDEQFGEVRNQAATTRHVEAAAIGRDGDVWVQLYDTPGLEDAGGVLDWLEQHTPARDDGIERLRQFLDSPAAAGEFNQEAKVLRQLLCSDAALYVIDAREPVLAKYKDELTILSWCAKPLMPVFNFTAGNDTEAWRAMLARRGLHISSSFDTVAFDFEGEMRLWTNLATMLLAAGSLNLLRATRRAEWQQLDRQARSEIADFLLQAAACRREIDADADPGPVLRQMQQHIRDGEAQLQRRLLQHYRFYQEAVRPGDWALQAFQQDPFDAELWKAYGIRTTSGAATGALLGLGLDVAALGASAGLGTAIGGLLGGLWPNRHSLSDTLAGRQTLLIDPATLTLLAARALDLLHTLQTRGHAAQNTIDVAEKAAPWPADKLPKPLQQARARPQWSAFNGRGSDDDARRQAVRELLADLPGIGTAHG